MQRLPLQQIFFFFFVEMKDYITTFTLTIYLQTQEKTDNLMVHMVTQERMGSPEAVVICILHPYHITYKKYCQSIALNHSHFVSSSNEKQRCVTKQNSCMRDQFPTRSTGYCVVTRSASPQKKTKQNKTKQKNKKGQRSAA